MVDGVYHMIYEKLKPGVGENDIVAEANAMLYRMGSDDVEVINAISGAIPIRTILPTASSGRAIRPSSTYFNRTKDTGLATIARSMSGARPPRSTTPIRSVAIGLTRR
jgi:hypothetical protein